MSDGHLFIRPFVVCDHGYPAYLVVFLANLVYNIGMKAAPTTADNQEPEVLDAATLAAIDKGGKSLNDGKSVSVEDVRPLIRERYQAWLKITRDLRK